MTQMSIFTGVIFRTILIAALLTATFQPLPARAQDGPIIIRDTEIENIIKEWTAPILRAAGLTHQNINIILVQSPQLNAFVAGGANIFLFTGLIERTDNPGELIGVFAHELGHISGGHLINTFAAAERASFESILGMVLGIGAAIASGNSQAATAVMAGSASMAQRRFLANSRVNESAADQAAQTFMQKAQMDPAGFASFLEKLSSEELLPRSQQSEYVRTHPLTHTRVEAAQSKGAASPFINKGWPQDWAEQHARMKAKLIGFTSPGRVPWVYNDQDNSMPAQYARTIADYRNSNIDKALSGINAMLEVEPSNPYFHELKGQMLVEFSRVSEALPSYRRAVELLPSSALIRASYAHALLEDPKGGQDNIKLAIDNLERALIDEKNSASSNRLLATAYGRMGREDIAKVYLAEEALLQRKFDYAKSQAEGALQTLPAGSREAIKAQDIISYADNQEDLEN